VILRLYLCDTHVIHGLYSGGYIVKRCESFDCYSLQVVTYMQGKQSIHAEELFDCFGATTGSMYLLG
jgi:hypothetical protein